MNGAAVIVDLDGTLVKCNSFTAYVRHIVRHHPSVLFPVVLRKLRLISHAEAKRRIMCIIISDDELQTFVDFLVSQVRRNVYDMLEGNPVILASAAPESYVREVACRLGIRYYIGTKPDGSENKGMAKLHNVMNVLDKNRLTFGTVITDHHDDLPLLACAMPHRNILVNPSRRTLKVIRQAGVHVSGFL